MKHQPGAANCQDLLAKATTTSATCSSPRAGAESAGCLYSKAVAGLEGVVKD